MTLYFFERITEDDFVGPVIVAAPSEDEAWRVLARRERREVAALKDLAWQIAQELSALPGSSTIVYPSHYRQAILD